MCDVTLLCRKILNLEIAMKLLKGVLCGIGTVALVSLVTPS